MKIQRTKSGFTLIELLVVITIIGILATGAVSIYTTQIQKARDSNRIVDLNTLNGAIEQFNQDNSQYPSPTYVTPAPAGISFDGVSTYLQNARFPVDPKTRESRAAAATASAFDYIYTVQPDNNLIAYQEYEVSTTFEQDGSLNAKAANAKDNGNDAVRYELGIDINTNDTNYLGRINAFPAAIVNRCFAAATVGAAGVAAGTVACTAAAGEKLVIR